MTLLRVLGALLQLLDRRRCPCGCGHRGLNAYARHVNDARGGR